MLLRYGKQASFKVSSFYFNDNKRKIFYILFILFIQADPPLDLFTSGFSHVASQVILD